MNEDTLQRFFRSFGPGGKPFVPNLGLEAPMGEAPPPPIAYSARYALGQQPVPENADPLDHALLPTVFPEVPVRQVEPILGPIRKEAPPLDFWDSLKVGFSMNTLTGVLLNHQRIKREVMALPGELQPVEGYDPLKDGREEIKQAGLEHELWSFRDVRSPNELKFRIWQFQARQADMELAQRAGGAGMLLGGMLDPLMLIPGIGTGGAAAKGVWGTFWRGARVASINAASALAAEGLQAEIDPSYRNQGILDAIEIPAALGFAVGIIGARAHAHKNTFDPPPTHPPGEGPWGSRTQTTNIPVSDIPGQLRERADFIEWMKDNKIVDKDGKTFLVFHGTTKDFEKFSNDMLGSNTGARSAKLAHFFASNPETTDSYTNFIPEEHRMQIPVRTSLWRQLFGADKFEMKDAHPYSEGDGANVRPTYIKMTNPLVVTDWYGEHHSIKIDPSRYGHTLQDINGTSWLGIPEKNGKPAHFLELGTKAGEARTADEIIAPRTVGNSPRNLSIRFKELILEAKKKGHDGVIIRNSQDGGRAVSDIYAVFDPETQIKNFHERYDVTPADILKTAPPHPTAAVMGGDSKPTPLQAGSVLGPMLQKEADIDEAVARSASSAAPQRVSQMQRMLEQEGLKKTGTGIETLPMNPALRLLQSASLRARELVTELVDLGGLKQNKNMGPFGAPTSVPVEAETARVWKVRAIQALHDVQEAWLEARGSVGNAAGDMGATAWQGMKLQARDWLTREAGLTWYAFDERVARAMRRGDVDPIRDAYSPFVEKAAAATRKFHDDLRNAGMDPNVDLFGKVNRKTIEKLNAEVAALKAKGLDSAQAEARLKNAIDHLGRTGTQTTALSYFTRYWNVDALMKGKDVFLQKVERYFMNTGLDETSARKSAREIYATLTRSEMKTITEETEDVLRSAGDPMSAKIRSLQIPDTEIEEFLESSATLSIRHQLATLAPAIEMTRRFGDADLSRAIETIQLEYKKLHDEAKALADAPRMQALERQMKRDIEDVQTLRDRLLNVAGASKDPHSWDQRTIRLLKHYMTWTTMGLSAISQLGDLARPAITEGLDAMHRYGFATLISDSRNTIMRMAERERYLAGDSLEVVLASKAMAAADIGDVFASRSNFERKAGQFTNAFYMLNGMNHAVDLTKTWASVIVQSNINDAIYKWGMHILDPAANAAPDALMMERLKSLSIDGNDALRMAKELAGKGIQFKSVHLANTEAWGDTVARDLYRQALQRALQRTVVTPGLGDKPTWMSTPMGSLIGQFKSFGISSTIRTLYAGLQDKDRNFWQGAAVLVGAGIVLNEIRSQLFMDRSTFDQPYLGILMDGVDRSGVLGSFTDINNALEAASNNKLGARPFLGAGKKYPVTPDRLANAFLGPSAGKAALAADMLGRIVQGAPATKTLNQARQFMPLQNWAPVKLAETIAF